MKTLRDFLEEGINQHANVFSLPKMIYVDTGTFLMGGNEFDEEKPVHQVNISKPFFIGIYPVTFSEFDKYCEDTNREKPYDEGWGRDNRPIINITWNDAQNYCAWLSEKTGETYRLPSESEWEYSCRAGTTSKYNLCIDDDEDIVNDYGWIAKNKTYPVGQKKANQWGIYDMYGNVLEFCEDNDSVNYEDTPKDGSAYKGEGTYGKITRGGGWYNSIYGSNSASRYRVKVNEKDNGKGFRVVKDIH